jgi:hypothetical protein
MAERRELGPGELAMRARTRLKWAMLIVAWLIGGVLGGIVGGSDRNHLTGFDPARIVLNPALSIVLAIGFLGAMAGLPLYMFGQVDEMKVQRNLRSMTGGLLAVLGGYPAWQMLAAGGLVPQPSGFDVFVIGYVAMLVSFVVQKLRG